MVGDLQLVLTGILAVVFGLAFLARRFPDVTWLQVFRFNPPHLREEQRAMVLPLGYIALTVMLFNSFTPAGIALVAAGSLLCSGLGITAIWRNRRRNPGK